MACVSSMKHKRRKFFVHARCLPNLNLITMGGREVSKHRSWVPVIYKPLTYRPSGLKRMQSTLALKLKCDRTIRCWKLTSNARPSVCRVRMYCISVRTLTVRHRNQQRCVRRKTNCSNVAAVFKRQGTRGIADDKCKRWRVITTQRTQLSWTSRSGFQQGWE